MKKIRYSGLFMKTLRHTVFKKSHVNQTNCVDIHLFNTFLYFRISLRLLQTMDPESSQETGNEMQLISDNVF